MCVSSSFSFFSSTLFPYFSRLHLCLLFGKWTARDSALSGAPTFRGRGRFVILFHIPLQEKMYLFALLCGVLLVFKQACSRGAPPTIQQPSMSSAVALLGQDVDFTCIVNDLGSHMVAFVKADSPPRLLSFDEKVFRRRNKYELKPRIGDLHNEWVLTIKNVQESDRGNYSCQINTEPITLSTGELDVKVPPVVSRSTPAAVEVREGNNVSLTCKADGNPTPTVIWRRQDRQIIRYNGATGFGASVFHGPVLHLTKVSRKHMSEYLCVASNGIPPDESWTVKLLVTFPPLVQAQSETVQASVGSMARMVCTTEAWPRPEMGWEKDGEPVYESNNVAMTHTVSGQYHSVHILEIRNVQSSHFGVYRCVAKNDNGIHHSQVTLNQISHNHFTNSNLIPEELRAIQVDSASFPSLLLITIIYFVYHGF
ncbi:Ig-like domain-containing protein [Caenorhabditis elegans]|uniref:Ig-like domain-containing protein n=2 Tax=Caenorhabditis elegans TaxID=6239 RepID=H2FLI8_CAEEL|nr:Ig-like domain-containing protein [Caenorhabditis elegans]CCF23368.1 Ig-like domain-containing protein [Caenorhabditis elegans]|eukprot:NP_001251129.1 neuRonal IGCAM [Caenorhabditis elegans]